MIQYNTSQSSIVNKSMNRNLNRNLNVQQTLYIHIFTDINN